MEASGRVKGGLVEKGGYKRGGLDINGAGRATKWVRWCVGEFHAVSFNDSGHLHVCRCLRVRGGR